MATYPNMTPNLGKLNFEDIKTSLTGYLKNQDTLKDFNFEGSVIQTLINLLAYNTYYYAFYSNMVSNEVYLDSAQRLDSLISLAKPLGYFVPLKTASKATINVSGLISDIPEYTEFRGKNADGIVFSFYTIESYVQTDSDALGVEIYQAKNLIKDLEVTNSFDQNKQRFFISDPDMDASTLKVKVQVGGLVDNTAPKESWTLSDNFGSTPVINQNVYYLERANNGVYVLFGKVNSLGNAVNGSSDRIFVDYIATNGDAGNGINNFTLVDTSIGSNVDIDTVPSGSSSSGGRNEPDLDLIRFAAPKIFGAQNRAVTKDDIKGLIAPFFESENDFNVFGGEEIFPQRFGRVFFTASLDPTNEGDQTKIQNIYNILRDKCVVTVVPEFTQPKNYTVNNSVDISFRSSSLRSSIEKQIVKNNIKQLLNSNYDTLGSYNFYFNAEDAVAQILDTYDDVIIEPNDFLFSYTQTFSNSSEKITINLENELDIPNFTEVDVTSVYKNLDNTSIKLVAYVTPADNKYDFINLRTKRKLSNTSFTTVPEINGRINLKKGIIEIYENRISTVPVVVTATFKNKYFKSQLNNRIKFTTSTVEIK
jgi:hypothetical protein